MKRSCFPCKALERLGGGKCKCSLGYEIASRVSPAKSIPNDYVPKQECPKPLTRKEYAACGGQVVLKQLQLGDVLYRPCKSYAGMKNFINASVVRKVVTVSGEDYVISYDAFRQSWTDNVKDVGKTVFLSRKAATNHLNKDAE